MPGPDMRTYLTELVGETLHTLTGKPNRILEVSGGTVLVGTERNEAGGPVSINFVQSVVDRVFDGEEVRLEQTGRYGFAGAVLRTFEDVKVLGGPRRARLIDSASKPNRQWSDDENQAAVGAYLAMLDSYLSGRDFVKKAIVEGLQSGPLGGRSRRSVESRFQNISFVMESNGLPWVKGYVPLRNVGRGVRAQIELEITRSDTGFLDAYRPTTDLRTLADRVSEIGSGPLPKPPAVEVPPERRTIESERFVRNPQVVAWVLQEAEGKCESCIEEGPFIASGRPFLEVHHVVPLSDGGTDSIDNAVAVCPNCHRRFHLSDDRTSATEALYESVRRLRRLPTTAAKPRAEAAS